MIDFERDPLVNPEAEVRIKVLGIGGAGGNTVNHMITSDYENVEFIVVNTDAQALKISRAHHKIQIGARSTKGMGAGANPERGKIAAEEDIEKITDCLKGAHIVFLTAGLGGGTGSGAIPVIAKAVREMGLLSVGVVTKPFSFEGKRRMNIAEQSLELLKKEIDTLIVIPNQKLIDVADNSVSLVNAFGMVNQVVHQFVKSISDIICKPGHINVDFADVCTVMRNMGMAVMGSGRASGEDRGRKAAMEALSYPLFEQTGIAGARAILLNITGSSNLGLHEVNSVASLIYEQAEDANIIVGSSIDETIGDDVLVTVIATGIVGEQPKSRTVTSTLAAPELGMALRPAHAMSQSISSSIALAHGMTHTVSNSAANSMTRMTGITNSITSGTNNNNSNNQINALLQGSHQEDEERRLKGTYAMEDLEVPTYLRRMRAKEL